MDLRLSESDRELILATKRELFLGLVLITGEIVIVVADSVLRPGHNDWIGCDQIDSSGIVGGFSFIVKAGEVTGVFSSSQLNRTPDFRLNETMLRAILELLPLSSEFKLY